MAEENTENKYLESMLSDMMSSYLEKAIVPMYEDYETYAEPMLPSADKSAGENLNTSDQHSLKPLFKPFASSLSVVKNSQPEQVEDGTGFIFSLFTYCSDQYAILSIKPKEEVSLISFPA